MSSSPVDPKGPRIRRTTEMVPQATRRAGIAERRLWRPEESPDQNVLLIDAAEGSNVESHVVANSESFFVIAGKLAVFGPGYRHELGVGDFCGFSPGMEHGVEVLEGPAQFLVVFAPRGG